MKSLWIYLHAAMAFVAWCFILVVLAVALLEGDPALMRNPVALAIAVLVTAGHVSSASYLARQIRAEIREAKMPAKPRAEGMIPDAPPGI